MSSPEKWHLKITIIIIITLFHIVITMSKSMLFHNVLPLKDVFRDQLHQYMFKKYMITSFCFLVLKARAKSWIILIIIMVIFKCYFSEEHIAFSIKIKKVKIK